MYDVLGETSPTDDTILTRNHLQSSFFKFREVRFGGVVCDDALETAIVRFSHGRLDAHFRGHAGENQRLDPAPLQLEFEIRVVKSTLTWFVDDEFAFDWCY